MKITPAILSIPPYLSTPWNTIASLQSRAVGGSYTLVVLLKTGAQIEVPGLDATSLNEIFEAHARFSATEMTTTPLNFSLKPDGASYSITDSLQHNPEQANLPDLPPQTLERMSTIAKAFGLEDTSALPAPEVNCNCIFCQIVRALGATQEEELITEADLHFRDWEVKQSADKLYVVTNPLDSNEQYNVYLGTPLGCTCGQKNCEHLKAVLNT